mgnify:CR=1 FL=1
MLLATTWLKHPAHGATAVVPGEDPEAPSAGRHSAFKAWGLEIDRASFAFPFVPNATVTREPLEASLSKLSCDLARPLLRAKASVHAADSSTHNQQVVKIVELWRVTALPWVESKTKTTKMKETFSLLVDARGDHRQLMLH